MTDKPRLPLDGETAMVSVIDDDLVLIAAVGDMMPATTTLLLNGDPSATTQAAVVSWPQADATNSAGFGFLALVPIVALGRGRLGSVVFRTPSRPARYALQRRAIPFEACLQAIAEQAGPAFGSVIDGMIEALLGGQPTPKRLRAALMLAQAVAHSDGFVEILGRFDQGEVFIQGWATGLEAGRSRVIVAGETVLIGDLVTASFHREDLGDRARGFSGLLDIAERPDPASFSRIFFRGRDSWRTVEIYERRVMLEPNACPGHLRAVLPRAQGSRDVLAVLSEAAHRFDGRDTVSELPLPVRLGIDTAAVLPGNGFVVSGWLLDPEGHVESVTLRSEDAVARLDETWTRQLRPDVTTAFQSNPQFAGRLGMDRHGHGFIAYAPKFTPGRQVYLELKIRDRAPAFAPLTTTTASARPLVSRLLTTLDPRSATAIGAIDRQFGPIIHALETSAPQLREVRDVGGFEDKAGLALVIGADHKVAEVGVLLALIAVDPDARRVPIVLAGPSEAFDRVGSEIQRIAGFYGLSLRLVFAEGVEDVFDAMEAGAEATEAETLALLSADVLPRERGWLGKLERAFRARSARAVVAPTILFEDDSIRWAGTYLEGEGARRTLVDRFIGYPREALSHSTPLEVTLAAPECCLLPKSAFTASGGFTRGYLGLPEKGLDFGLKLKRAGVQALWVPEVEMLTTDDLGQDRAPWRQLARRADRWAFDRRWSLVVSNMRS